MTRPDPRRQAALSAAFAGAVDLSALAQRAAAPASPAGPAAAAAPADGPGSEFVFDVTEADFQDVIQISTQVPVVFDLRSDRAPESAQLSAMLLAEARRGQGAWVLARVDVDTSPRIAQAFGVQSIPTVIAVAGGQPVAAIAQVPTEQQLSQWFTQLLDQLRDQLPGIRAAEARAGAPAAEPEDPRFTAAEELLDAGDFTAAEAAYQAIVNSEPANTRALEALAQTRFLGRVAGHPEDTVARADAVDPTDPQFVALTSAAADLEVAGGQVEAAFTRLIAGVKATGGDERTALREHLVSLFGLFTTDDPQVRTARRALAAALY